MKITIGNGTPIEATEIKFDGGCMKIYGGVKISGAGGKKVALLLAYKLRDGECVRRTEEGNYEVQL